MELPLVSVIITTYKRADYLNRAIQSVLAQTYENLEILVVDDNDPNSEYRQATENLMEKYSNDSKVRYIKHSENRNGAAARNTGLNHSKGKFITYLDDDDTYRRTKVDEQVQYLLQHQKFDAVYCGWMKDGKEESPSLEGDISFEILSGELIIRTNTIMMNRLISLSIGGWNEDYRRNQEAVYLLRYLKAGYKIGSVSKVLVDYDSSDRSNESNPGQYEEDFDFFLSDHKKYIRYVASKRNRDKNIVYSMRYLSVFLRYLKNFDMINAIRVYYKSIKTMPIRFNREVVLYLMNKVRRK